MSYGTEQRPVENFVPPSAQKFEFIVFRGGDVKDIKVVEDEEPKQATPPNMPNDPAILVRSSFACSLLRPAQMMKYFGC
jgi:protein LSM14